MLSMAKSTGSGELILPKGKTLEDAPASTVSAINYGLMIMSWSENLTEKEMPPEWMWPLDWEIESWFITVRNNREKQYGVSNDNIDDVGPDGNPIFERNELFESFGKD